MIDGDTLPGIHNFASTKPGVRPDEGRIDANSFYEHPFVHVVNAAQSDLCKPIGIGLLTMRSLKDASVVVLPEINGAVASWPAVSAGTLALTNLITITDAYIASTNFGLQISGVLTLGGNLHSHSSLSFVVDPARGTISLNRPVSFDTPGASNANYGLTIPQFTCSATGCTFSCSASVCSYTAQFELPNGITVSGSSSNSLPVVLGSDGIFRLQGTRTISWGTAGYSISIKSLEFDTSKGTLTTSGTLTATGASKPFTITNISFGQATPSSPFFPTGTIALDQDNPLKIDSFLTIKHLSGDIAFQGANSSATLTANADVTISLKDATSVTLEVQDLRLSTTGNPLKDIAQNNLSGWSPDFSIAKIVPDATNSSILGHALDVCPPSAITLVTPDPDAPKTLQFCIGIHLTPGATRNQNDLAYANLSFTRNGQALSVHSLVFSVPPTMPATVALAGTKIDITALRFDIGDSSAGAYGGFDSDIGTDVLVTKMNCLGITTTGQATISDLTVGGSVKEDVAITPTLGLGPNCTAFSLRGALPIQLTQQSSLLLTSLVYVHTNSKVKPKTTSSPIPLPPPKRDVAFVNGANIGASNTSPESDQQLDYLKASGSFTSGNVTVFFNGIGFRTFIPNQNPHSMDPNAWDCNRRDNQEYEIPGTHMCAIINVNLPMTLAATGVQNSSAIEKAIQSASSGALGFLLGKK